MAAPRLLRPWDSPGKNIGVGCHFLLQYVTVKSESEVSQSCLTLCDPMDCSLPGSSICGIFQARVLEWGAIAFSEWYPRGSLKTKTKKKPAFFPATVLHSGGPRPHFYQNKTLTLENISSRLINGHASKEMIWGERKDHQMQHLRAIWDPQWPLQPLRVDFP